MGIKRGDFSTIDVTILDNKIEKSSYASVVFINSIKKIINIIGSDIFLKNKDSYNGTKFLAYNIDEFPKYIKKGSIQKMEDFYITTHSSTDMKKTILESIFNFHNIDGEVNIISRKNKIKKHSEIDIENLDDVLDQSERKIWLYAPGEGANSWDEFYNNCVMGFGWDDIGDYSKLGDRNEIEEIIKNTYNTESRPTNSSLAVYQFRDEINIDDIIIAKLGTNKILGYGIVESDYYYDETESTYKSRRDVNWIKRGGWNPPSRMNQKTLTDITDYKSYVNNIKELIGIDELDYQEFDQEFDQDLESIETEDNFGDDFELTPPSSTKRIKKFDIEGDLKQAQAQAQFDDEVQSFKRFRAIETDIPKVVGKHPLMDSLCILGESGAGKSYTIENILENENHEFKFIIPTASATGLLSQFSPSENKYILSKLGEMLIESAENPNKLYTVVFDEFHKPSIIEMINDELLQAISTKRNRFRFISLDSETINLYKNSKLEFIRGNIKIPDNFGFIFISSKPKVIANNPDLFRRLDFIYIKEDNRDIKTINQLLSRKINKEERDNLLNIREDQ